jgi:hypothetical protein
VPGCGLGGGGGCYRCDILSLLSSLELRYAGSSDCGGVSVYECGPYALWYTAHLVAHVYLTILSTLLGFEEYTESFPPIDRDGIHAHTWAASSSWNPG